MAELPRSPESREHAIDCSYAARYEPLLIERAEGAWLYTARRPQNSRRGGRRGGGQHRAGARGNRATGGRRSRAWPTTSLPVWIDAGARAAGRAARAMDSAGSQSLLLHQRRLGGGRGGDQVRADVPQGQRPPAAEENHLARGSRITATRSARSRSAEVCAARRLRARAVRLAAHPTVVLLPLSVGQDLPRMRYRLRRQRSKRRSRATAPTRSRRLSPSR